MSSNTEAATLKRQKFAFSKEEDDLIISFVGKYGLNSLQKSTSVLPNRTARQVRERYRLYLDPNINHNAFTFDEDELLLKLMIQYKRKWSQMAKMFNKRTDVALKYRYMKLSRRMGFLQTNTASNEKIESQKSKYIQEVNQPVQIDSQLQFAKSNEMELNQISQKIDLEPTFEQIVTDNYFIDSNNDFEENEFEHFCW
jgi:hypothetical protein